jgi:acetoin utilization deacetylase AcuC-like enzyme
MQVFRCDQFTYPLPEGHRFPAQKYRLLRERVESLAPGVHLQVPEAATDDALRLAHDPDYVGRVRSGGLDPREVRRIGLPWSPELVERSLRSVGGTIAACRAALEEGLAVSLSGGTHHAFSDRGEGFCVFNDVAVAARLMQAEGRAQRIAVVDCDVHQGNGTAAIFADDPAVFTFSMHGAKNFPFHKERSDLDVELPDGAGDDAYLESLDAALPVVFARALPDLVIYLAGSDPYSGDSLGRLGLGKAGLAERDRRVLGCCTESGIPAAVVMAGGYARPIEDTVDIHFETVRLALEKTSEVSGDFRSRR